MQLRLHANSLIAICFAHHNFETPKLKYYGRGTVHELQN